MKFQDFNKVFFALMVLHLAVIYKPESQALYYISKPLVIFSLLAFYRHKSGQVNSWQSSWLSGALMLGVLGEIAVMLNHTTGPWYQAGLLAPLAAQFCFSVSYSNQSLKIPLASWFLGLLVPFLAFLSWYTWLKMPSDQSLLSYAWWLILAGHFFLSLKIITPANRDTYWPALGALLFIVAYLLFNVGDVGISEKYQQMLYFLTLSLAHYLVVIGVLRTRGMSTKTA